jgi:hypothetical protein
MVMGARKRLSGLLGQATTPQMIVRTMHLVQPFLDTWPLASLIEGARTQWADRADARSLAVMARTAHVVGFAVGWPESLDRRWPMPSPDWIKEQVPAGDRWMVPRGHADGAIAAAVHLDARLLPAEPDGLPTWLDVPPEDLGPKLNRILDALRKGAAVAVRVTGPVPVDAETLDALSAIRAEAPMQEAIERYGLAGLLVGDVVKFDALLQKPAAGKPGERVRRVCDVTVVPGLDDNNKPEALGVLAWDGPFAPVIVVAGAVEVARRLDGVMSCEDIAHDLETSPEAVRRVVDELVGIGAATAA